MSKWAKTWIRTRQQSGKFRVLHHFPVKQPSKLGKDNAHDISDTMINKDTQSHIMLTVYIVYIAQPDFPHVQI